MSHFKTERCLGLADQEMIRLSLDNMEYFACLVLKYEIRLLGYIKKISQSNHDEGSDDSGAGSQFDSHREKSRAAGRPCHEHCRRRDFRHDR